MDDPSGVALRKKKDSSMRVAIQQVQGWRCRRRGIGRQHGRFDGHCPLSAERRWMALIAQPSPRNCPTPEDGATTVLDLGANVDCSAEHLLQFAVMGSALVSALQEGSEPM